ncbi:uncharacterized protein EDB91DRAFT_615066 [Suillus paluster]|uniref:uncharacterized protein n=1 Tax=Suillus paluster TaxID=48578 RepID=UPI001B87444B|nr:uncharacterized protein EDB91DRAFT_615066 [Suillus paluster]KAG1751601.1 hypothetical protein EDB91DRAFT_615066 [Suillus paluster]
MARWSGFPIVCALSYFRRGIICPLICLCSHIMQIIPSLLSVLEALLKSPAWLLRKILSLFVGKTESPPLQEPSSGLYPPSDSPYEGTPSQRKPYDRYRQVSPRHPAVEPYQTPSQHSDYQTPSPQSPYRPRRQPSAQYPTQSAPVVPRDVLSVVKPVSHIPQRHRDVPSVVEPVSYIPQRHRDVPSVVEPVSYIPQRHRDVPSVVEPVSYIPQRHRDVPSVVEPVSYIPQRHRDVPSVVEPVSYIPQVGPSTLHLLFTHFFDT